MRQKYHFANENGILIWDITAILEDIDHNPEAYSIRYLPTSILSRHNNAHVSRTQAMLTDISKPLVVAELSPNHLLLIDGNHRLFKAELLGIQQVPCYYLPVKQQQHFIQHFRPAEYKRIISVAGC